MRISDWSSDVCSSQIGKRDAGKCGNASDFRSEQALHMTREDDLGQSNENAVDSHRISDCRSIPAQIIDRIKCPYDRQRLERWGGCRPPQTASKCAKTVVFTATERKGRQP